MSAVSTSDVTGTVAAAHRTDAPVWAFHLALAWTLYAVTYAVYAVNVWEHRVVTRHPFTTAVVGLAAAITAWAALIALVVNA